MDVAVELVRVTEEFEHRDEIVHHFHGAPRNAGGDEKSFAPTATSRLEKDSNQLLRLEQRARHVAIASHRTVMAVEAAGVGHEDAQQRGASPPTCADGAEVQRSKSADFTRVSQSRREVR